MHGGAISQNQTVLQNVMRIKDTITNKSRATVDLNRSKREMEVLENKIRTYEDKLAEK